MKKKDLSPIRMDQLGFSQREFLYLFILKQLTAGDSYPKLIHQQLRASFPEKVHSYDYLCKVAKKMAQEGLVDLSLDHRKHILTLTEKGVSFLQAHRSESAERLKEVLKVVDRFVKDLTGSGTTTPVVHQLSEEHRSFFSKLVSVKDLVRYITLKEAMLQTEIYMSEIRSLLQETFGWEASNGYLYVLASEMEETGLVTGRWESDKRSRRFLRITDEGTYHYKQIADSTRERLLQIQKFLNRILYLLEE